MYTTFFAISCHSVFSVLCVWVCVYVCFLMCVWVQASVLFLEERDVSHALKIKAFL